MSPSLEIARSDYIKLLKQNEQGLTHVWHTGTQLTPAELALARESFTEGWIQCELERKRTEAEST